MSPTSRRRLAPLLPLVLALVACTDRAASSAAPAPAPEAVFRTLAGERLVLGEARGPVLVSFWSTACAICLEEMPELVALYDDYAARGVELVAVAMPHDPPNAVLEFAESRGLPFPVAIDLDGAVLAAFEPIPGTPASVLVDADGRIVERHLGRHDFPALRRRLDALLADARA